jgi:predicted lipid-binding transport protein (Tim44 family)
VVAKDSSGPTEPTPKLSFWLHQTIEYFLGVFIVTQAIQGPSAVLPVSAGVLVIVLAATADGPLAAFHLVPRRIHRWLDLAVAAVLLVGGLLLRDRMNTFGLVVVLGSAALLVLFMLRTDYSKKLTRAQRKAQAAASAPTATTTASPTLPAPDRPSGTPTSASTTADSAPPSSTGEQVGRLAGRMTAKGMKAVQKRVK